MELSECGPCDLDLAWACRFVEWVVQQSRSIIHQLKARVTIDRDTSLGAVVLDALDAVSVCLTVAENDADPLSSKYRGIPYLPLDFEPIDGVIGLLAQDGGKGKANRGCARQLSTGNGQLATIVSPSPRWSAFGP
ncbi:MAG: hypothetical protein HN904_09205 [Victivallales bacterium]|nr:hypothetical protein [Victivallales bacterium]